MAKKSYPRSFYHPRFWLTWLAIGAMHLAAWLPWCIKLALGRGLGLVALKLATRRRRITETNIALCFPERSAAAQHELVRDTFIANGIGLMETATAWCRHPEHLRHRVAYKGKEHMAAARARGKGVLIVGVHFSTLDMGGALHSLFFTSDAVYRPHDNPLFNHFMTTARKRVFGQLIDRHDLRSMVRQIRSGNLMWYSPDQDFGRDVSVFAPWFGQPAATIRLTAKIARMTGAPVVPLMFHRNPDNMTYTLECLPAMEDFPSNDEVADATRINAFIETAVRHHPEQYLWLHRRFKTPLPGKSSPYSMLRE